MSNDKDRVRKAREEYEARQAHQKRIQNAREQLEKPGMLLKMIVIVVMGMLISFGVFDGIFESFGFYR
jgi:hypothetical protein